MMREKTPKARGIGMQMQHEPIWLITAKFMAEMLLATLSVAPGILCIRAEIPPTKGIKRPERPDNNTTPMVAIIPTVLLFIVNLLLIMR